MDQYILLPDSGHYKILQLLLGEEPHIEFKPAKGISHGKIFKEILEKKKIPFKTRKADEFPEPKGENYELTGAGFAIIDKDEDGKLAFYFSGDSDHYKVGINEEHVENWRRRHNLTGENYEIIIKPAELYCW